MHNPCAFARSEVVEACLDVPADVPLDHLVIETAEGAPVEVQEFGRQRTRAGVYHPRSRNMPFYCTRVRCCFLARDVPPLGHATFRLAWKAKPEYPYPHEDWDAPRIPAEDMLIGQTAAENEFLAVHVNSDGTFDLVDKETGLELSDLHYFLDQADVGNMWMAACPGTDGALTSEGQPARVSCTIHGPLLVEFEIEQELLLPAAYDHANQRRACERVPMPVRTRLRLRKDSPFLEVRLEFENTVRDHHLKVCFPTQLDAEATWAEGPCCVTEYPVTPSERDGLRGPELARHPAQLWFDISDGGAGLALLLREVKDYEVLEHDTDTTLAMGLVRAVPLRIPCDNRLWMEYPGDESAQSLKKFAYEYALMPHSGWWDEAQLHRHALAHAAPLRVCQFGKQSGRFPHRHSSFALEGDNLVLSAVKKTDERDTLLIRCYNPTGDDIDAVLHCGLPASAAWKNTLAEERVEELRVKKGAVAFSVRAGEIAAVEVQCP